LDWYAERQSFEISPRFRQSLVDRIERLERDAELDEEVAMRLEDAEHLERHLKLVATQRAEALRMRVFLERAKTRLPRPLIAL
jgi:hypothetical protein